MNRFLWFLFGVLASLAVALSAGGAFILGANGFSAREQPTGFEHWFARRVRSAAIPNEARRRANLVSNTPDVQAAARAHWADHCAVCHGNDGSGDTQMGRRTYPPAPNMRLASTQQMTDGELFYIIQNGIRLTAMPAWGDGSDHDAEESWKLVHFIRHLPQLTLDEKNEMEKLNPKSPDEIREELEEERFLKGEDHNESKVSAHHH